MTDGGVIGLHHHVAQDEDEVVELGEDELASEDDLCGEGTGEGGGRRGVRRGGGGEGEDEEERCVTKWHARRFGRPPSPRGDEIATQIRLRPLEVGGGAES
jgi:hypothetical protein